jgi:hypothetical protein
MEVDLAQLALNLAASSATIHKRLWEVLLVAVTNVEALHMSVESRSKKDGLSSLQQGTGW